MALSRWTSLGAAALLIAASSPAFAKDTTRDDRAFGSPDRVVAAAQRDDDRRYGDRDDDRWRRDRDDDRWRRDRDDDRWDRDGDRNRDRRDVRYVAFNNGRADGYEKGLNDARDRHNFDPTRHKWYRNADRNYNSRYGSRAQYENTYRDGFRQGYEQGYREGDRYGDRRGGFPFPR